MKAEDIKFTALFEGPHQYIVPVFQRDYSWGRNQCQQLWDDVVRAGKDSRTKAHFVGSVVYIAAEENSPVLSRWLLIDGQQRITTVTLLLAALRAHLLTLDKVRLAELDETIPSAEELDEYFLRNRHGKGARRYKLCLRRADHETLAAIVDGTELPPNPSHRVKENFEFFLEQISEIDPVVVYLGITKLVAVDVSLTRGQDDPQMIFESLNSTGKDLSQADLIRNFVLMRQTEEVQTRLYQEYWQPIEHAFGNRYDTHFDRFMRDFLNLRLRPRKPLVSEEVYSRFKDFYHTWEGESELLLAEIKRFARYYSAYNFDTEIHPGLRRVFLNLRTIVDVASPVMLHLYDTYDRTKTLTIAEFEESAVLLESYVFRRSVCEMQTRSLGNIFVSLAQRINPEQPLRSLKVVLWRQGDSRKFPSDVEFVEALVSRDIYHMRSAFYFLDRLENDSKEKIDTSTFSIEHVMPQNENLGPEWRQMLGPNWRETQVNWLHRLGNVTLTGYNSKYSDRPFDQKKSINGGFSDSPLRLNRTIREADIWTPVEMEKRGQSLAERAIRLWPSLTVDQKWVREAELSDHLQWAERYPVDEIPMEERTRFLFDQLRPKLNALGDDIHELGQSKSIVYRVYDFFLEVVPRKAHLGLVLNLDFAEYDSLPAGTEDATQYSYVVHAKEQGGVYFTVWHEHQITDAVKLARLAYEKVTQ